MPQTFELYFRFANGATRRRILTCRMVELMDLAKRMLSDENAREVEICSAGQHLFSIAD